MKRKIGYCKLGRSWNLDVKKASTVGGDIDCIRLLKRLATQNPDTEYFLIGKNSGEVPQTLGYPDNVVNPWSSTHGWKIPSVSAQMVKDDPSLYEMPMTVFRELTKDVHLDGMITWVGQHSSTNSRIPAIDGNWKDGPFTTPLVSSINYTGYLLDYCDQHGVEPLFLVPDPRNTVKVRDLRIPLKFPVLAQYEEIRNIKQDLGPDVGVKQVKQKYIYSALEMTALDEPSSIPFAEHIGEDSWKTRDSFVLISNENKRDVPFPRSELVREWLIPHFPDVKIYGTWSDEGKAELGRDIQSIPVSTMYETLRSALATITFPASGSKWVTSKVWEAFASGTVCFIHPRYDMRGLSLPRNPWNDEISKFLHVSSAREMANKVAMLRLDYNLWLKIVMAQRQLFVDRFSFYKGGTLKIEECLNQRLMEKVA
jgi:hypothetical protein